MVLRVRTEEGRRNPEVVIRYALMRSNVEELPDSVERWGEMGINRIDSSYLAVCNGIDPQESLFFHQELMERVFVEARRVAVRYPGLTLNLPQTLREAAVQKAKPKKCKAPWSFVKIDTDGRVLPCYRAWEALSMGKVYDADGAAFGDIWNSVDYQALRRSVNDDGATKHFPYCGRCEYRYGWSDIHQHVGYEEWADTVAPAVPQGVVIDHRREKRTVPGAKGDPASPIG